MHMKNSSIWGENTLPCLNPGDSTWLLDEGEYFAASQLHLGNGCSSTLLVFCSRSGLNLGWIQDRWEILYKVEYLTRAVPLWLLPGEWTLSAREQILFMRSTYANKAPPDGKLSYWNLSNKWVFLFIFILFVSCCFLCCSDIRSQCESLSASDYIKLRQSMCTWRMPGIGFTLYLLLLDAVSLRKWALAPTI